MFEVDIYKYFKRIILFVYYVWGLDFGREYRIVFVNLKLWSV